MVGGSVFCEGHARSVVAIFGSPTSPYYSPYFGSGTSPKLNFINTKSIFARCDFQEADNMGKSHLEDCRVPDLLAMTEIRQIFTRGHFWNIMILFEHINKGVAMDRRGKLFYYGGFVMFLVGLSVSFGISIWALNSGNFLASVLALVLGLIFLFLSIKSLQEVIRVYYDITKIELCLNAEVIADLEKIRKYYEFKDIKEVVCDSLDLSIMALREQTMNDRILCLYNKKNKEIIAIDSMTSDGEIWEEVDGKNTRDEIEGESEDDGKDK